MLFAALAAGFASAADGVSFAHRPLLAGKASLTSDGLEDRGSDPCDTGI